MSENEQANTYMVFIRGGMICAGTVNPFKDVSFVRSLSDGRGYRKSND